MLLLLVADTADDDLDAGAVVVTDDGALFDTLARVVAAAAEEVEPEPLEESAPLTDTD